MVGFNFPRSATTSRPIGLQTKTNRSFDEQINEIGKHILDRHARSESRAIISSVLAIQSLCFEGRLAPSCVRDWI